MKNLPVVVTASRAGTAFQKAFVPLAILSLIPIVVLLLSLYLEGFRDYSLSGSGFQESSLSTLLMYAASILVYPAMVRLVQRADKGEEVGSMSLGEHISQGAPLFLPLLVTWILAGAIIGVGLLALIIPGIIAAVFLALVGQSVVLGEQKYFEALKDSFNLVRGQAIPLFIYLLFGLIIFGLIQFLVMAVAGLLPGLITLTAYAVMTGLGTAFQASLTTAAYLQLTESSGAEALDAEI
jgi:hypothetical protein